MSELRQTYKVANPRKKPFSRRLTLNGEKTGPWEMLGDYSLTPTEFWTKPDPGNLLVIEDISLILSDAGAITQDGYGSLAGLLNGLIFFSEKGEKRTDSDIPIKTNTDLIVSSSSTRVILLQGGERILTYHKLYFDTSDGFDIGNGKGGVLLEDDFTGLLQHGVVVSGYQILNEV